MTASEQTRANLARCDLALERIFNALETLKDVAQHDAATWPDAGNAGKCAEDLEHVADFIAGGDSL